MHIVILNHPPHFLSAGKVFSHQVRLCMKYWINYCLLIQLILALAAFLLLCGLAPLLRAVALNLQSLLLWWRGASLILQYLFLLRIAFGVKVEGFFGEGGDFCQMKSSQDENASQASCWLDPANSKTNCATGSYRMTYWASTTPPKTSRTSIKGCDTLHSLSPWKVDVGTEQLIKPQKEYIKLYRHQLL